jgi:hypothetical protein
MALQIRRGTTAERNARRFLVGELIYDTTSREVWIGDSTNGIDGTLGGIPVTAFSDEDAQDAIRDLFSTGTHTNISYSYNDPGNSISSVVSLSNYVGSITASGTITASGFNGWLEGNVFANDSTLLVDAGNGRIPAEVVTGTFTGTVIGNASSATLASTVSLTATSTNSDHFVTFVDTSTGNENVRTDADLKYNPSTNTLTAGAFVGNVTGAVTGNIFTALIDSADSSAITFTPAVIFSSDLTVQNELYTANLNSTDVAKFTVSQAIGANFTPNVLDLYVNCGAGNTLSSGPRINFTVQSTPDGVFNPATITAYKDTGDIGVVEIKARNLNNGAMDSVVTYSSYNGAQFNSAIVALGGVNIQNALARPAPATSAGVEGDFAGDMFFAEDTGTWYLYYCIADWTDGLSDIWVRWAQTGTTW